MENSISDQMVSNPLLITACEEFFWIIPDFNSTTQANDKRQSGIFKLKFGNLGKALQFSLSIKIANNGSSKFGKEAMLLFITGDSNAHKSKCKMDFDILTSSERQKVMITSTGNQVESVPSWKLENGSLGYFHFLGHRTLQRDTIGPLIDDTIVVRAKVTINIQEKQRISEIQLLRNEMLDILNQGKYSDFKIICQGKVFFCHKTYLARKSKVFEAMFEMTDSIEFKEGRVVIEDCSPDDIQAMLEFIYTGDLQDDLRFCSEGVLMIGDKYDVSGLVEQCEESLTNCLTIGNAVNTFVLADMYNLIRLKEKVSHFISNYLAIVKETEDWKQMLEECPRIVEKILQGIK